MFNNHGLVIDFEVEVSDTEKVNDDEDEVCSDNSLNLLTTVVVVVTMKKQMRKIFVINLII